MRISMNDCACGKRVGKWELPTVGLYDSIDQSDSSRAMMALPHPEAKMDVTDYVITQQASFLNSGYYLLFGTTCDLVLHTSDAHARQ